MIKTYSDAIKFLAFEERFDFLKLNGSIGESTFGFNRYVNQKFYTSNEWRRLRNEIIIRDDGCDLAHPDHPINGRIYIHHINPVTLEQLENEDRFLMDAENLICVSYDTHSALHYGYAKHNDTNVVIRRPGDTTLW